jgi:hypothetical protein
MSFLTSLKSQFDTTWSDFIEKDQSLIYDEIYIDDIYASNNIILVALNTKKYSIYDGKGYGVGSTTRGITEEEAYNLWINDLQTKQRFFKNQIKNLNLLNISQSAYDGLFLYYYLTKDIFTVNASEGVYSTREAIIKKNWDVVASMIMRSQVERLHSTRAATVLRLADYGIIKNRAWLRSNGIFEGRSKNQIGVLSVEELTRARFAYYAETKEFLPYTPDTLKRDIAKRYEETLMYQTFVYETSNTNKNFTLLKVPSMDPIEKLEVKVNGDVIQHYFEYTLSSNTLTIIKDLKENDIISTIIKI